ncbi:MAG: TrbG/VirB9 family P-type conjugative transfer protein [Treponema sp.]|jgi:type IV secretion system protein VirB9|nr:TrbG/VirB9 family P-type conjugative transfer protein [Treponema sp.]
MAKTKIVLFIALSMLAASCRSVDMERRARDSGAGFSASGEAVEAAELIPQELWLPPPPEIVVVERTLFVPEDTPPPAAPAAATGHQAVRQSNTAGIQQPQDFSYAAMVFDFNPDWVYQVFTQPSRITSIRLEPGELVVDSPFISDSERWILGAGVSYEQGIPIQYVYVKPIQASLQATLIINTDRRVYHLIMRSFNDLHMPMVRWRYPQIALPFNFITPQPAEMAGEGVGASPSAAAPPGVNIDPRFLSFDYRVTHSWLRRPAWFPELVFDDGRQTYIVFPQGVLQGTLPAVFDNRNNVVNYRVFEHVIIIDRLIERSSIRLDGRQVVVEKRRTRR